MKKIIISIVFIIVIIGGFVFYNNTATSLLKKDLKKTEEITDGDITGTYDKDNRTITYKYNGITEDDFNVSSVTSSNDLLNETEETSKRFDDTKMEKLVDNMEFYTDDDVLLLKYENGKETFRYDFSKKRKDFLNDLDFEKDKNEYVKTYKDESHDYHLRVSESLENISIDTDNAKVKLKYDGSLVCTEGFGGNCEDAKTTTALADKGQQIRILLIDTLDYKENEKIKNDFYKITDKFGFVTDPLDELLSKSIEINDEISNSLNESLGALINSWY